MYIYIYTYIVGYTLYTILNHCNSYHEYITELFSSGEASNSSQLLEESNHFAVESTRRKLMWQPSHIGLMFPFLDDIQESLRNYRPPKI